MKNLNDLVLNENGLVFDPTMGETFMVNDTGLEILSLSRKGLSDSEIAARLAYTFDVTQAEAMTDVLEFFCKLRIMGFQTQE